MARSALVQSVVRGLDILALLADSEGGVRVRDVALALNVKPPTAHNLLRSLMARGFAARRGVAYDLGPAIAELAARQAKSERHRQAVALVREVASALKPAIITFSEPVGLELIVRLRLSPDRPGFLQEPLARSLDWYPTATGRAALAFMDDERRQAILNKYPLDEYGGVLWKSPEDLNRALAEIRREGFAALPYRPGQGLCVAMPVFNGRKELIGCLGVRRLAGMGDAAQRRPQVLGIMKRHIVRWQKGLGKTEN